MGREAVANCATCPVTYGSVSKVRLGEFIKQLLEKMFSKHPRD